MLTLKNITVSYQNNIILDDINLTINKGEVVSIIGPSGSGKSTLIRTMNYLVEPKSGEVIFEGEVLSNKNINEIRKKIGMVFQQFELFPHLTVLDNMILAPVTLKMMTKAEAIIKANKL